MTEVHHISTHNQATIIIVWCSWTKKGICPPFFGIRIKVSIFNKICFKRTQTYMLGEQDMIHHLLMLSILQRCCIIWFPPRKKKKEEKNWLWGSFQISVLYFARFFKVQIRHHSWVKCPTNVLHFQNKIRNWCLWGYW